MPVKNLYDSILLGVYSEIHLPKMYTIVIVIIPNQAFQPNTMSYAFCNIKNPRSIPLPKSKLSPSSIGVVR